MGEFEVEELFFRGRIYRDVRIAIPGRSSGSYRSALIPGFSDAHAHPQVIDVGEGGIWRNSYDWISRRKLKLREGELRKDVELSSKLASLALKLSLLDGATFVAMTGSLHGNIEALRRTAHLPRVVVLPTVMNREGWPSPVELSGAAEALLRLDGGRFRGGIFIHSLGFADPSAIALSLSMSRKLGIPVAIHLNEGVQELDRLMEIAGGEVRGMIAVHCIEEPERCRREGLKVVSCPLSNLHLYGRTIASLEFVDAFGSDWPLVIGTVKHAVSKAAEIFGPSLELLSKATAGGYEVFGMRFEGDAAFYDEPLSSIYSGKAEPKLVLVEGEAVVEEGKIDGEGRAELERELRETKEEALSKYSI